MAEWEVKKGKSAVQDILIQDKDDTTLTNLATAISVKFQVKSEKADTVPLIAKTLTDGIEINTPSTGYVRITLDVDDTDLTIGLYCMGL